MKYFLWATLIFSLMLSAQADEGALTFRTWTSESGKKVQAQLISFTNNTAILQLRSGKKIKISAEHLSSADRQLLISLSGSQNVENSGISAGNTTNSVIWFTSYEDARSQAKKENKKLFILFSDSEYCKPCRDLKSYVLTSDEFLDYAKEKLILFKADEALKRKDEEGILAEQTEKLMKKYPHRGVPWVFIARKSGSIIGQTGGYLGESPDRYIKERLKKYVK